MTKFYLVVKTDQSIILDTSFDMSKIAKIRCNCLANYKITTDQQLKGN